MVFEIYYNIIYSNTQNSIFETFDQILLKVLLLIENYCHIIQLLPELICIFFIFYVFFKHKFDLKKFLVCTIFLFSVLFIITAFFSHFIELDGVFFFFNCCWLNQYSLMIKSYFILFIILYLLVINIKLKNVNHYDSEYYRIFFIFLLFFCLFIFFFISINDLFGFYLLLEGLSFLLIIFFVLNIEQKNYILTAIKYFCLNSFSSGCILFSISIFYGLFGTTNFFYCSNIMFYITILPYSLFLFMFFFLIGVLLKLGCFPFASWLINIYSNSSYEILYIFSIVFKSIFFFILFRLFSYNLNFLSFIWSPIFMFCGISSIIFGTLSAFNQKQVKKFFAYSSIIQSGFIVLGLSFFNLHSFISVFFYNISYIMSSLVIFLILFLISEKKIFVLSDLSLLKCNSTLAYSFSISVLSMAGLPPTFGFFAKYCYLQMLIVHQYELLAIILLSLNLISLYYYLNILKNIWFVDYYGDSSDEEDVLLRLNKDVFLSLFVNLFNLIQIFFFYKYTEFINLFYDLADNGSGGGILDSVLYETPEYVHGMEGKSDSNYDLWKLWEKWSYLTGKLKKHGRIEVIYRHMVDKI